MARTTGYTATVAARMLAKGLFDEKGITPPEFIGRHPECVDYMLKGMAERGIEFRERIDGGEEIHQEPFLLSEV